MDEVLQRRAAVPTPRVRSVELSRPLLWLQLGYRDLLRLRTASLGYGVAVAVAGAGLLAVSWGATYLVPALMGGFLLVAPFAAIGLYALSQQLDEGRRVDPRAAVFAWRRNAGSIALFGLMLTLALIAWERLAAIVFALTLAGAAVDPFDLVGLLVGPQRQVPLAIAFFGAGAVLAAGVFALSVVSAPMLVDRPVDLVTATVTSLRVCARNPVTMAVWAALIAVLAALGFLTLLLGMVVVFPLLGHASWHAYRDLVE